jgi:uncharacterized RDD family membrane protein YckC
VVLELDETHAARGSDPARTETLAGGPKPETAPELPAGLRLGHFRIDRRLGAGGMGEVYLATDLALDRPVAIKVLPVGVTSGTARDRLIREARAQARVQHPNVAHIYFIGEDAGRLYFAMEYIAGKTLAERLAEAPLPVEEALSTIRAAVLGLREAQRSGFMHRDVKPSNLMVDGHGVVKVLDFGLAAAAPAQLSDGPVAQTSLAGTPLYMAPEQATGDAIDFRADIYALGATLYHLVSGRPPFQADTVAELYTLHASAARPAVPRGSHPRTAIAAIDALVGRMMAQQPADRFGSYDELLRAIELASMQHTRPAGFWVRAIAQSIDFLIVAIAVGLATIPFRNDGNVNLLAILPVVWVYSTLAIGRWGKTAGKAIFELEVVAIDTSRRPSWGKSVKRQAALFAIPSLLGWGEKAAEAAGMSPFLIELVPSIVSVLFVLLLVYASLRRPGKRAPWDRVSGTMERYRTAGTTQAAAT